MYIQIHGVHNAELKRGRGITRETLKQKDIEFVKNKFNKIVNDDEADAICIGYAYTLPSANEINFE